MVAAAVSARAQVAEVTVGPDGLAVEPLVAVESLTVSASGPGGIDVTRRYPGGATAVFLIFDENGAVLPDGSYTYQVTGAPALDPDTRDAMAACREAADCDSLVAALRVSGALPDPAEMVQSGSFSIDAGYVVLGNEVEEERATAGAPGAVTNAQVFATDLIVQGSACIGLDCVSNESFGFDTLRLKENNLRIHFQDTSVSAGFPTRDWRIEINGSNTGGPEYFRVQDVGATTTNPFTIQAGAGNDALVVDAQGDVGFGTGSPIVELHSADGDTPTLRLEQNGTSGFAPQTFDVAVNEANFFIRDVTNGSQLPFRIKPGADTDSLFIAANNDIGIGTDSPAASLEVTRSNGTGQLLVDENSGTVANRSLLKLENNGNPQIELSNTDSAVGWKIGMGTNNAFIAKKGTRELRFTEGGSLRVINSGNTVFFLLPNGNLQIDGTLREGSDVQAKRDIEPLDGATVLNQVAALPVSAWSYKDDETGARHVGPMAQDFHAAFGLGEDDTTISPRDLAGVALAAVKELEEVGREKDQRIEALEEELKRRDTVLEALEARLEALERRLSRPDRK